MSLVRLAKSCRQKMFMHSGLELTKPIMHAWIVVVAQVDGEPGVSHSAFRLCSSVVLDRAIIWYHFLEHAFVLLYSNICVTGQSEQWTCLLTDSSSMCSMNCNMAILNVDWPMQELRNFLHKHRKWLGGTLSGATSVTGNGGQVHAGILNKILGSLLKCCDPEVRELMCLLVIPLASCKHAPAKLTQTNMVCIQATDPAGEHADAHTPQQASKSSLCGVFGRAWCAGPCTGND
jgi:hypothetical protein